MESSLSLSFSSVVETFVIMLSFAYGAVVVVVSVVSELSSSVAPETVVVVVSSELSASDAARVTVSSVSAVVSASESDSASAGNNHKLAVLRLLSRSYAPDG